MSEGSDEIFCFEMHKWKQRLKAIIMQNRYSEFCQESSYEQRTLANAEERRNPRTDLWRKKAKNLLELMRKRKGEAVFWCVQGDAVASVGAEATVDGGGGAPEAEQHKEDDAKGHEGEKVKMTPQSYL